MKVLFVCHANICRSPLAERLAGLLAYRQSAGRLDVASAGTHAATGDPIHPGAAQVPRELGADPDGHTSRPLTAELVSTADLVLTATREQRAASASLVPAALGRVFTLRQFGRLAAAVDPSTADVSTVEGLRAAVARARGSVQPVPAADDDLADPVNGTLDDVRACATLVEAVLLPWLGLVPRSVGPLSIVDASGEITAGRRSADARWPSAPGAPG